MADRWEELEKRCQNCRECSLCETRTNVVFGDGSRTAEIMFVGEGPGAHEDEQGVPFVGKAGQLLDDMLAIIGLDRTMVYIANIVKCRPPQNRDPLGVEQDACIGYLREQVTLLRPKLIVCLGRIAAMRLIREDFKITREHGQWVKKGGFELMAMYHPAALLRDPTRRPDAFEDLMSLRERPARCASTRRCRKSCENEKKKRGVSRLAFRFFLDRSVGLGQQKDRQQDAENADAKPHGQHLVVDEDADDHARERLEG